MMTPVERLRARFAQLQADGLLDLKLQYVAGDSMPTMDELATEVLAILDAIDAKRFVDISEKIQ